MRTYTSIRISVYRVFVLFSLSPPPPLPPSLPSAYRAASVARRSVFLFLFLFLLPFSYELMLLYFCLFVLLSTAVLFLADLLSSSPSLTLPLFSLFFSLFLFSKRLRRWPRHLAIYSFEVFVRRVSRTPLIARSLSQEGCFLSMAVRWNFSTIPRFVIRY